MAKVVVKMKEAVQLYKKKKYINWFLETYRLKRPEAAKILHFLMKKDVILLKVHFVENVRRLPNALIISATDAPTVSFLCRINNVYYENIDEVIAFLDLNPPADLFVWLSFDREYLCSLCRDLLEVQPKTREKIFYHQVVKELEEELNRKQATKEEQKARLEAEINAALERRDRERFDYLARIYKELFG